MATQTYEVQDLIIKSGSLTLGIPDFLDPVTTITASAPSASRTYILPDVGASSNIKLGVDSVQSITAATTLSGSGQTCHVSNAGSAYNITLPAVSSGANFKLYVISTLNAAVTVTAGSAIILGSLISSDGTAVSGGAIAAAKTNVIFGTGSVPGDHLDFYSDGSKWYVTGFTSLNTALTVS